MIGVGTEPRLWAVCRSLVFPVGYRPDHTGIFGRGPHPRGCPPRPRATVMGFALGLGHSSLCERDLPAPFFPVARTDAPGCQTPAPAAPLFLAVIHITLWESPIGCVSAPRLAGAAIRRRRQPPASAGFDRASLPCGLGRTGEVRPPASDGRSRLTGPGQCALARGTDHSHRTASDRPTRLSGLRGPPA